MHLPGEGYFEGAGDALFCGETLFAGYRFRSDVRSHQWIGATLGVEVLPLELVDPRFYHLDTCFCPLSEDAAIYHPGAFDDYGRSVLRSRVGALIEVSAEEAASFSCNAVVVGRTVVLNEETPKLSRSLVEAGYAVRPTGLTEVIKAGGSAKCLTLRLDGEEAASWRRRPRPGRGPPPSHPAMTDPTPRSRRLYLLRHGVAVPHGTEGYDEDQRPLTEKGERRVRQVARGLRRIGIKLDKIVTSPLPRASRTAEIVADILDVAFLLEDSEALKPSATPESIRDWFATRAEPRIMLVGHNPNLSEFLALILVGQPRPNFCDLRKGGLAALRDDPNGRFQVDWIARPRLIRRLGD